MNGRILIIDDEDLFREDLSRLLTGRGYECRTAADGEECAGVLCDFDPDIVLCDIALPGVGGIELLGTLAKERPETCVIMITAFGTLDSAIDAFRKGASDYITKPLVVEDLSAKIDRILDNKSLTKQVACLRRQVSQLHGGPSLKGDGAAMSRVRELIERVSGTRSTVLLQGDSGTGKEVVAREIHRQSASADLPFVAINCAAIPESLLQSELFGHVRGAFTGAAEPREGYFDLAGEGTVFLDEISSMPLSLQSKLLRVLEERTFARVGENILRPFKARVIVSSNRPLQGLVEAGRFREDLYFRIHVFEIVLPPLRERREDIPSLIEHFITRYNKELGRQCLGVDNEVASRLLSHPWPGNVRELRNVIERAMILSHDGFLHVSDLPAELIEPWEGVETATSLADAMKAYEKVHITRVLQGADWNKEEAARRLSINPSTLYRKMADLRIAQPRSD